MLKQRRLTTLLAVILICVSFGALAKKPLRIGVIVPLTGDLQVMGVANLTGVKLAAAEINHNGGVLGSEIKIFSGDTQTLPQVGVNAAQQLVNIHSVVGLVGAMSSGTTIPIATAVAKPNHVPQIATGSTSPKITHLNDGDFLFRTIPSDALQGVALAHVVRNAGVHKIGIIYINNDYGEGLKDAFAKTFKKLGGHIVGSAGYEQKQPTYNAEVNQAYGNGTTDALLLLGYPQNGVTILRESLENGKFNKFFFADGMETTALVKNMGAKYLNGSLGTAPAAQSGTMSAKHFTSAYKKLYGKSPPQPYIDRAYDATYLLALAAEKAGTVTNSVKIRDSLRAVANPPGTKIHAGQWAKGIKLLKEGKKIDWVGAAGSENFDKHGDIVSKYGVWTFRNGAIKTLKMVTPR